jgi:23S rRNA (guanine745-N1)-methyltransferase
VSIDPVLDLLRCPHCAAPLQRADLIVRCASGHAFDLARQGYLNLLGRSAPANADSAAMVASRERFLDTQAYAPISDVLIEMVTSAAGPVHSVLDVGAGSGYYLARALERVDGRGVALDVSVYAARRAARAHDRIGAVVADAWGELPLVDGGIDAVLSVFAPRQATEFARVLRPGGLVVIVAPLPDHLVELRHSLGLLDIEPDKDDRIAEAMAAAFRPDGVRTCRYQTSLAAPSVVDLVSMGPNAFHHDHQQLVDRVAALGRPITVSVATTVTVWRRQPAAS